MDTHNAKGTTDDVGKDDDAFLEDVTRESVEEDDAIYGRFMTVLVKRREIVLTELFEAVKEVVKLNDYKHFHRVYLTFGPDRRRPIVDYVFENWHKHPEKKDPFKAADDLSKGLAAFLNIGATTLRRAPLYLKGAYQLWRPSNSVPGWYVKGMIRIFPRGPFTLAASMIQKYEPDEISAKHLRSRTDYHQGCIVRQSGGLCIMLLRHLRSRELRVTYFSGIGGDDDEHDETNSAPGKKAPSDDAAEKPGDNRRTPRPIFSMIGRVMGVDDGRRYIAPLYVERVSPRPSSYENNEAVAELRRSLNIYRPEEVPAKVRQALAVHPVLYF